MYPSAGVVARQVVACGLRRSTAIPLRCFLHSSIIVHSAEKPGPVETKLRKQLADFKLPEALDLSVIKPGPDGKRQYRWVDSLIASFNRDDALIKKYLLVVNVPLVFVQCENKAHRSRGRVTDTARDSGFDDGAEGHPEDDRQVRLVHYLSCAASFTYNGSLPSLEHLLCLACLLQ